MSRCAPTDFVPPGRATRALSIALGANTVMAWMVLIGIHTFFERVWRGLGGGLYGQSLEEHWAQIEIARRMQGLAWLVTALLFLLWLHRVYGNLRALGATRLRFSPGWAVGTFFVPGVNLVWPFLVVREIWTASAPDASDAPQPPPGATSPWVAWWWGCFVTASMLDPGPWRLMENTATRFGLGVSSLILVVGQLAEIAAAVLGIVVVRRIDTSQARAHAVGSWPVDHA